MREYVRRATPLGRMRQWLCRVTKRSRQTGVQAGAGGFVGKTGVQVCRCTVSAAGVLQVHFLYKMQARCAGETDHPSAGQERKERSEILLMHALSSVFKSSTVSRLHSSQLDPTKNEYVYVHTVHQRSGKVLPQRKRTTPRTNPKDVRHLDPSRKDRWWWFSSTWRGREK